MATQEQRENRLRLVEDHIGRALAESERSGELQTARSYGKPLDLGDGYDDTPAELRMAYKMLKDSGFVPPEVTLMREINALREQLAAAGEGADGPAARRPILPWRPHSVRAASAWPNCNSNWPCRWSGCTAGRRRHRHSRQQPLVGASNGAEERKHPQRQPRPAGALPSAFPLPAGQPRRRAA